MQTIDSSKLRLWALVATTCRFIAGGAFLFAAFNKLAGPKAFALSITTLDIVPRVLVPAAAFTVPWAEVIIGLCLLYGLWSRAAGWLAVIIYSGFTLVLLSAIMRGLSVDCGCFGDAFGSGEINAFSIIRNSVFIAVSLVIAVKGGGPASLDAVFEAARPVAVSSAKSPSEKERGTLAPPVRSTE